MWAYNILHTAHEPFTHGVVLAGPTARPTHVSSKEPHSDHLELLFFSFFLCCVLPILWKQTTSFSDPMCSCSSSQKKQSSPGFQIEHNGDRHLKLLKRWRRFRVGPHVRMHLGVKRGEVLAPCVKGLE